ncbi:MAG TPA: glycosyltransferase family 1 protein [Ilumatobacteraceae bacterium]|nr:glycosyltransferase family 1 protein [Ilumatobacteraceae bacterium]HRB04214.1 glycosyltransferase family 1 protein [Ilumatobacteraceae bacterium]
MSLPSVLVNMLWCVPGKVGGSEEYLVRQLLGLAELPEPRWRPTVAAAQGLGVAHPELSAVADVIEPAFESTRRLRRIAGEITWLRGHSANVSLVHHGGGTAPIGARRPYVLSIHDLQFRTYPQYFSPVKRAYLSAIIPPSARRAAMVAVPSEYVRGAVVRAYGIPDERVAVVPHGIEPGLVDEVTSARELREKYRLGDGPVIVYPAVTHPHKNHRFLLEMMRAHWTDPNLRLVLAGGEGLAEAEVAAALDPRVRRVGRVSAADRNGLLAMADAMVFPSQYEGFGAPLIEAMVLGAPVISSDATCMPHIVGNAGLVRPLTTDGWADVLDEARTRRDELVAAGHIRAQDFTSAASGAALAAVYEKALST